MINAETLIEKLNLTKHPEGGYYNEAYRSDEYFVGECLPKRFSGNRNFGTAIYFLLKSNEISAWHKIKQDEIWHHYLGSTLTIHTIDSNGNYNKHFLGKDIFNGQTLQLVVPFNTWMAADIEEEDAYSLVGCTTAPGFDFSDFELGEAKQLLTAYPQHKELILKYINKSI